MKFVNVRILASAGSKKQKSFWEKTEIV